MTTAPRDVRLQLALEVTGTGLWEWDVATNEVTWSPSLGPLYGLGYDESPATYEAYLELEHPEERGDLATLVQRAIETGEPYEREYRTVWPDGSVHWLSSKAQPLQGSDGSTESVIGLVMDITARKRREIAADYLSRAGVVLAESLDEEDTLRQVAALAVPELADWCGITLLEPDGSLRQVAVAHQDPEKVALARSLEERWPTDPDDPTGVPAVVRSGQSELYSTIDDALVEQIARDPEHLEILRGLQPRSLVVVPVAARGRTLGAMTFILAESGHAYGEDDLKLAEELGRRAGLAIANVRLYAETQRTAEILQRSLLLEQLPELPDAQVSATYLPGAEGAQVGGDWYDVLALPDGRTMIGVGDVMGRGVKAAALMGQLRTVARSYALIAEDPCEVLDRMRDFVALRGELDFATFLMLSVEPSGRICAACAGHLPPLVVCGSLSRLAEVPVGPPLGVAAGPAEAGEVELEAGATLVLYTDGLVESRCRSIDDGLARLVEVATGGPQDPEALIRHLLEGMLPGGTSDDDVALLALRRDS